MNNNEISGETRRALNHRFWQEVQNRPHHPFTGTPAPSTTEDLTITFLFAEAKSLNMSKVKPSAGVKPRLTPAQLSALEVKKGKENKTRPPDEIPSRRVLLCSEVEFMQYCVTLTKRGQYDIADGILGHIMVSSTYQAQDYQNSIRIALITCSILAKQPDLVVEQARKLITTASIQQRASQDSPCLPRERPETHSVRMAVKSPGILSRNRLNRRYAATATTLGAAEK
ncbi:hypothetical protein BJ165DRAFT_1615706 [Panaeolus papilionaceus]|nr:hypothetical protein BJ165DRAFT_1615706 [Panaeolus papilionaceus]